MELSYKVGVLFALTALCLFAVLTYTLRLTQADAVLDTQVAVLNSPPTVGSVATSDDAFGGEDYVGGEINTLVPDGARDLYVTGIVEDLNGRDSIVDVTAVMYRSGVDGGVGCEANENDCYVSSGCELLPDGGATEWQWRFSCPISLAYFADGTMTGGEFPDEHWVVGVRAQDDLGGESDFVSIRRELQTLLAVEFPWTINYGVLSAGDETDEATRVLQLIFQAGNDVADVEVSYQTLSFAPFFGGVMDCVHNGGVGSIPGSRQKWSVVDGGYESPWATSLTDIPTRAEVAVPYRHGTNPSVPIYWNVSIPETGVSGTCSGSISISAVSH